MVRVFPGDLNTSTNPALTHLTIESDASVDDCSYQEATISGTLDGDSVVRNCRIHGLDYISGVIKNSELTIEPIYLGTGSQAMFINCWSGVPGTDTPTIDVGGTGQKLGVRGYNGGLRITNRTGNDAISIDMVSGHVIIDSTCTGDPMTLRGTYKLTVEAGATAPITDGRVIIEQNVDVVSNDVWTSGTRTLTEGSSGTCDENVIAEAVWDYELPVFPDSTLYPQGR